MQLFYKYQKKLDIKISDCRVDKNNMEDIEIAMTVQELVYTTTHSKDREYRSYKQVRKLHIMLSKQVIATKYSDGVYSNQYGALGNFDVKYAIKALYADRAYDRKKLYKLCNQYGIKMKIPQKTTQQSIEN